MTRPGNDGFTLIELSVVLVVVGLIVGGILVGNELIRASQVRGQVGQIEKLESALVTFRGKYNCVAGDCPTASRFFTGTCTNNGMNLNGNGNGRLDNSAAPAIDEGRMAPCHLFKASLMPDDPSTNSQGSGFLAKLSNTNLNFIASNPSGWFSTGRFTEGYYVYTSRIGNLLRASVSAPDAAMIDVKADDGLPLEGKAVASEENATGTATSSAAGGGGCVDTSVSPNGYNVRSTATTPCGLGFRLNGLWGN